jgi:hypothetical protein
MKFVTHLTLYLLLVLIAPAITANIHHDLKVTLNPEKHFIQVADEITIPAEMLAQMQSEIHFLLHGNLTVAEGSVKLKKVTGKLDSSLFGVSNTISLPQEIPVQHLKFKRPKATDADFKLVLIYSGEIYHPIEQISEEYARSFSETPGIIDSQGVVLAGASYWLPWFNAQLVSFNLEVTVPKTWDVVSQGARALHETQGEFRRVRWESPEIMDEVYLIASPFTEFGRQVGAVTVMAFLRSPDENLANKYLETTAQYLQMYQQLIGQFPYKKFALVENFWETGYGMPSFTLLGPKIIRFPWILHSSYPHELLHNYWGNSVFVDYEAGNWCEGLTVYQADHLIKEQQGLGAVYRRDALQVYTDYVKSGKDFPLIEFRARHDATTAAVGYNKSMMVFHTLRQKFGDEVFTKAIQRFYRTGRFKKATFADIQQVFEDVTGEKLGWFFQQWIYRIGAPELKVTNASVRPQAATSAVAFTLEQSSAGAPYRLEVPVAMTLAGQEKAFWTTVEFNQARQEFVVEVPGQPQRIDVDPLFDIFRRLDRNEIPAALSQVFGADAVTLVLPAQETPELLAGYQQIAETWSKSGQIQVVTDQEITALPADRAVWLLGAQNRLAVELKAGFMNFGVNKLTAAITLDGKDWPLADNSFVLTLRNPANPDLTVAWMFAGNPTAASGLARKLPHYGKYSYLGFTGEEPTNTLKGQWPTINSPMSIHLSGAGESVPLAALPERKALAELTAVFSEPDLMRHVAVLADDQLQGRGFGMPELDQAADYIAAQFKAAGLLPGADDSTYFQPFPATGGVPARDVTLKNVIGFIPGTKVDWQEQSVVVCAHYDHLGLGWPDVRDGNAGKIHNGADDNASGVAVLIELARHLAQNVKPDRNIVFIAFSGEEARLLGSSHYVVSTKKFPPKKIIGALNLDTVGRLHDKPILVLGAESAQEWPHIFRGIGFVSGIQSQLVQEKLDASDQTSFIQQGIPAVQLFSGPHADYHRPTDDIEKIDAAGLVKVASFTKEAVIYLAEREEPLTRLAPAAVPASGHPSGVPAAGARRASLGTMPDFGYSGDGVKIGAVTPDSPAARAGIQVGDVLKQLGAVEIKALADLSNALKKLQPGDEVAVVFERDGKMQRAKVILSGR